MLGFSASTGLPDQQRLDLEATDMPRKSTAAAPVAEPTLADAFTQIAALATASQVLATSVTELRSAVVADSQRISRLERAMKSAPDFQERLAASLTASRRPARVVTVPAPATKSPEHR